MDGNTNGAGATMHIFISYFPLAWSCVRGSSSYFLTLFDPVIFVPCPWPYYCLTESHRVRFPALSFPESPRRNPDFDDNPLDFFPSSSLNGNIKFGQIGVGLRYSGNDSYPLCSSRE